jgi:hypothetical protein
MCIYGYQKTGSKPCTYAVWAVSIAQHPFRQLWLKSEQPWTVTDPGVILQSGLENHPAVAFLPISQVNITRQ